MARLTVDDDQPKKESKQKFRRRVIEDSSDEDSGSSASGNDSESESESESIRQVVGSAVANKVHEPSPLKSNKAHDTKRQLFPTSDAESRSSISESRGGNGLEDMLEGLSIGGGKKDTSTKAMLNSAGPSSKGFFAKLQSISGSETAQKVRPQPKPQTQNKNTGPQDRYQSPQTQNQSQGQKPVSTVPRMMRQNNPFIVPRRPQQQQHHQNPQHPPKPQHHQNQHHQNQKIRHNPNNSDQKSQINHQRLQSQHLPKKTFNSPVKSFDIATGSLLEPMTPKSKKWGQRINAQSVREAVSLDTEELDLAKPIGHTWGTDASKAAIANSGSGLGGNSFGYVSPEKATEAIQDLLQTFDGDDIANEGADTVEGLKVNLMKHQIKGLAFLKSREAEKVANKGALLCDDMGLGKTVQSIALILSNFKQDGATLVVAPLALVQQWATEIREKAPKLKVTVHHGTKRAKTIKELNQYDVIVTTYNVLTIEHQSNGPLYSKEWWRVILDEAHTIKNKKSKSCIAACSLDAQNRLCLTGTPIQNNVDELFSLIQFLNISPYNDYKTWKSQISDPLQKGRPKLAMRRLHVVLAVIMLRRTKDSVFGGSDGFQLPKRRINREYIEFDEHERQTYDTLEKRVGNKIQNMLASKAGGGQYLGALLLLLRLRQTCDHLDLTHGKIGLDDKESVQNAAYSGTKLASQSLEQDQDVHKSASSGADELADVLSSLDINQRDNLKELGLEEREETQPSLEHGTSSKIRAIMRILKNDPERKTIVFSQFTTMMDLIEPCFRAAGIGYVRYDGSMRADLREKSLAALRNDDNVKVLLCSLKCGALGLNLTVASRVVLVDPWWNPMISEQAIDRVHRIGQTQDVDVHELIIARSIEERILGLQDKKRELAKGVVEGDLKISDKLSQSELLSFFKDL